MLARLIDAFTIIVGATIVSENWQRNGRGRNGQK
jgi:hypothetical protein